MSIPRIIGITGYAQHGKDSIAEVLVKEYGYQRAALADVMKRAMMTINPFVQEDGGVRRLTTYTSWEDAKKNPEVRRLLQVFGTEVGRRLLGEDVWISALAKSVPGIYNDHGPKVVIPDIRFINEGHWVYRTRGEVWRVKRVNPDGTPFDNGVGTSHASEREISSIFATETFRNDTTVEGLKAQVRRYIAARERYGVETPKPTYA